MMCLTDPDLVEALVVKCINQSIALLEIAAELGLGEGYAEAFELQCLNGADKVEMRGRRDPRG